MSAKFRNTTALVAAFSLAIPAIAPAQEMVDRCEAGSVGIDMAAATELGLELSEDQQAALNGEASSDDVIVSTFDGERALCMTYAELEEMGASEADVVMAVEAQPSEEEMTGESAEAEAEAEAGEATAEAETEAEAEEPGLLESALDAVTGEEEEAPAEETAEAPAEEAPAEEATETEMTEAPAEDATEEEMADAPAEEEPVEETAEAPEEEAASEEMAEAPAEEEGEEPGLLEGALDAVTGGSDAEEAAEEAEAEAEAAAETEAEVADTNAQTEAEVEAEVETAEEETGEGDLLEEALNDVEEAGDQAAETAEAATEEALENTEEAAEMADEQLEEVTEAIEQQSAEEANPEEQAEVAEDEAPEASVAAAAAEEGAEAEVEEEVVTEENTRQSSEEFEGEMQTTADAEASTSGNDDDDDGGLSNFEKALLAGAGAIVVGEVLKNNQDAQVVSKSDDRVVVLENGRYRVIRDDNQLIERPGSTVRRETFDDGSTRTTVTRDNGVQIVTIRDSELRVLRRIRIDQDGNRTVLIDDTADVEPVEVTELPDPIEEADIPYVSDSDELRAALDNAARNDRRFALYQVRGIERVRKLAPAIDLDAINFRTGSAVIDPQEAEELSALGNLIRSYVEENPGELFLVEGHTDAVGNAAYNLALSDRRAESVALALTEYFDVPPENLVVQGYGESDLKVRTLSDERANRRAAVRRITPLVASGS